MKQIVGRSSLKQVAEFHETFSHPIAKNVGEESLLTRQLRIELLFEELQELAEATDCRRTFTELCKEIIDKNGTWEEDDFSSFYVADVNDGDNVDHVAELDALCDLQVVLDGKFLTSGHWKVKDKAFAEVHRSNMSKSKKVSQERLEKHIDHLVNTGKAQTVTAKSNQQHTIFYREDGKILKGPNFSEPNLKQFVK